MVIEVTQEVSEEIVLDAAHTDHRGPGSTWAALAPFRGFGAEPPILLCNDCSNCCCGEC